MCHQMENDNDCVIHSRVEQCNFECEIIEFVPTVGHGLFQYIVRPTYRHRMSGSISIEKEATWDFDETSGFKDSYFFSLEWMED